MKNFYPKMKAAFPHLAENLDKLRECERLVAKTKKLCRLVRISARLQKLHRAEKAAQALVKIIALDKNIAIQERKISRLYPHLKTAPSTTPTPTRKQYEQNQLP